MQTFHPCSACPVPSWWYARPQAQARAQAQAQAEAQAQAQAQAQAPTSAKQRAPTATCTYLEQSESVAQSGPCVAVVHMHSVGFP